MTIENKNAHPNNRDAKNRSCLGKLGYFRRVLNYFILFQYILTEEHNNRNFVYRMFYPWILFAAFRQRIYSGMTLAQSVCTSAGLGAYPVEGRNRTSHGPTVGYLKLKQM